MTKLGGDTLTRVDHVHKSICSKTNKCRGQTLLLRCAKIHTDKKRMNSANNGFLHVLFLMRKNLVLLAWTDIYEWHEILQFKSLSLTQPGFPYSSKNPTNLQPKVVSHF